MSYQSCLVNSGAVNSSAVNSGTVNSIKHFLRYYFLQQMTVRMHELNTPHLPFLILHLTGQLHLNGQGVKWFVWDLSLLSDDCTLEREICRRDRSVR